MSLSGCKAASWSADFELLSQLNYLAAEDLKAGRHEPAGPPVQLQLLHSHQTSRIHNTEAKRYWLSSCKQKDDNKKDE